jgi:hypothetical protein
MGTFLNLVGLRFGKLLVREIAGKTNQGIYRWLCVCDCGNLTVVRVTGLTSSNTKSCGCGVNAVGTKLKYKQLPNGTLKSDEYNTWKNMKSRCYSKNSKQYFRYGGRGITVCDKWRNDFIAFLNDMGCRPSPSHSLDRIEVNGNYEPSNCRWATKGEQSRNRRNNHLVFYNGKMYVVTDLAKEFGVTYQILGRHLNRGKTIEQAVQFFKTTSKTKNNLKPL